MKQKMKLSKAEERKLKMKKIQEIIETPINYTFEAQKNRLKLEQPTP